MGPPGWRLAVRHFGYATRQVWGLMTAIAHCSQDIGYGLDEDTAMLVRDDEFTVLGSGAVAVIVAGTSTHTNITRLKHGQGLELRKPERSHSAGRRSIRSVAASTNSKAKEKASRVNCGSLNLGP